MEMHLQPLAGTCFVSGEPFVEGARVASYLVRQGATLEIARYDVLETQAANFAPDGYVACKWMQVFKPRRAENAIERRRCGGQGSRCGHGRASGADVDVSALRPGPVGDEGRYLSGDASH